MTKLHANGRAVLHIDDAVYTADENGMIEVEAHHAEMAMAHGATRDDPALLAARAVPTDDHAQRIATMEVTVAGQSTRIAALEALVKDLPAKGKK